MKKSELVKLLDETLNHKEFENVDISLNGVQVDNNKDEINTIAFGVDASLALIEEAKKINADMIFVHHGFYWGHPIRIEGAFYNRIASLIKNNIMLYASHLPLDASPHLGNNFTMARILGLKDIESWGEYRGVKIGAIGNAKKPLSIAEIVSTLGFDEENDLKIEAFGKTENIEKIAIISGGAAEEEDLISAIKSDADLYITGEHSHTLYHFLKENKMSMISGGHYKTEVFGPQSTATFLTKLGLNCKFIDIPTGM